MLEGSEIFVKVIQDKAIDLVAQGWDNYKPIVELANKILTYNYGVVADAYFKLYGNPSWLVESSEENEYTIWQGWTDQAIRNRKDDIKKLFKIISHM